MTKKHELNDSDKAVFKEAMKGVKPLTHTKITKAHRPALPLKRRAKTRVEPDHTDLFQFSDYDLLEPVDFNALIEFFRPGLQHKIVRKMQTGQYDIEAKLDLHGMIVAEAREALAHFIVKCMQRGIRQVLIIHGKGRAHHMPILKNKLNHWLRQTHDVLAFCSTKTKEGGTGALYVLLRSATP